MEGCFLQKKRIHNTENHHYYKRRQRTTENGEKGEIIGLWKNPKNKKE